ncbi:MULTISPECIES: hypothetical protein [unclassified Marinobacter]|uniref:hypothetical protein n=1 Tax=unclassified Marinobacter TaxID=83889 RepID=UPI0012688D34|nr:MULTISPECIES: hypothetical protein [unclassified Marinobacter]QFS87055.1 hypothetical protein FIV08_09450 [Marinobacter sp. THAF197a]QFT50839.1 hypothetical protein FIU96_09370 [Marinobacter sp. THAF39]
MAYPKLPEWPIIDPDRPPVGYIKVAHHEDRDRNSIPWDFFVTDGYLLLVSKEWIQYGGKPGRFITEQYEYPIEAARWFVTTISRFFLEPGHPNAVPRGEITIEEQVGGEILGVTRGAQYGSIPKSIPGYSLDNLNRFEHTSLGPDDNWCQMFKMGDPWLFEQGLLDVFKDIAERHERGEF